MMRKKGKMGRGANLAAIYSLLFLNNCSLLVSPAMSTFVNAFSDEPYSRVLLISTLPSLTALPCIFVSGSLAGTKVRYRTILLLAIPMLIISGVLPFWMKSLGGVLLCRVFCGIGMGLIGPMGNALLLCYYSGEERVRVLGMGSVILGLSGCVFQQLGGRLSMLGWRYVFLAYFIALIPMLLVLFGLIEPDTAPAAPEGQTHPDTGSGAGAARAAALFVLVAGFYVCLQTKSLTLSSIISEGGMGNAQVSAAILSAGSVGAMLSGLVFPIYCRRIKRFRIPILSAGLSLVAAANLTNVPVLIGASYALDSLFFMMLLNLVTMRSAELFDAAHAGRAVSLIQCADKGGTFLATYFAAFWVALAKGIDSVIPVYKMPVVGVIVVYLILALVDAVVNDPCKEERAKQG